jgi:hypothetical protein
VKGGSGDSGGGVVQAGNPDFIQALGREVGQGDSRLKAQQVEGDLIRGKAFAQDTGWPLPPNCGSQGDAEGQFRVRETLNRKIIDSLLSVEKPVYMVDGLMKRGFGSHQFVHQNPPFTSVPAQPGKFDAAAGGVGIPNAWLATSGNPVRATIRNLSAFRPFFSPE